MSTLVREVGQSYINIVELKYAMFWLSNSSLPIVMGRTSIATG